MLTSRITLGLLSTAAAIVWLVLPGTANAASPSNATVEAAAHGLEI